MNVRTIPGSVATILISDPQTRNALSTSVLRGIARAVDELSALEETRVIVLTGEGGTFSSGGNLKENVAIGDVISSASAVYRAIAESPQPVIAQVEGHCLGLALGIAAACDLVIAAQDTTFALSEVRLGQAPTIASLTVVPRLRPADANHLLLTGSTFGGDYARDVGLVNESVPSAELDAAVRRLTEQLIAGGPVALSVCKQLVRALTANYDPTTAAAMSADLSRRLSGSPEANEGRRAYLEHRLPDWADHPGSAPRN